MGFDAAVPTPRLRSSMNELPFADDLAEMLIDAAPDAMMLVDADGVIRLANDAAADIFDRTESDLVGSSVDQLVPDEHRAGHAALRDQYVSDPTRRPMRTGLRLSGRRSDGAVFTVPTFEQWKCKKNERGRWIAPKGFVADCDVPDAVVGIKEQSSGMWAADELPDLFIGTNWDVETLSLIPGFGGSLWAIDSRGR